MKKVALICVVSAFLLAIAGLWWSEAESAGPARGPAVAPARPMVSAPMVRPQAIQRPAAAPPPPRVIHAPPPPVQRPVQMMQQPVRRPQANMVKQPFINRPNVNVPQSKMPPRQVLIPQQQFNSAAVKKPNQIQNANLKQLKSPGGINASQQGQVGGGGKLNQHQVSHTNYHPKYDSKGARCDPGKGNGKPKAFSGNGKGTGTGIGVAKQGQGQKQGQKQQQGQQQGQKTQITLNPKQQTTQQVTQKTTATGGNSSIKFDPKITTTATGGKGGDGGNATVKGVSSKSSVDVCNQDSFQNTMKNFGNSYADSSMNLKLSNIGNPYVNVEGSKLADALAAFIISGGQFNTNAAAGLGFGAGSAVMPVSSQVPAAVAPQCSVGYPYYSGDTSYDRERVERDYQYPAPCYQAYQEPQEYQQSPYQVITQKVAEKQDGKKVHVRTPWGSYVGTLDFIYGGSFLSPPGKAAESTYLSLGPFPTTIEEGTGMLFIPKFASKSKMDAIVSGMPDLILDKALRSDDPSPKIQIVPLQQGLVMNQ